MLGKPEAFSGSPRDGQGGCAAFLVYQSRPGTAPCLSSDLYKETQPHFFCPTCMPLTFPDRGDLS